MCVRQTCAAPDCADGRLGDPADLPGEPRPALRHCFRRLRRRCDTGREAGVVHGVGGRGMPGGGGCGSHRPAFDAPLNLPRHALVPFCTWPRPHPGSPACVPVSSPPAADCHHHCPACLCLSRHAGNLGSGRGSLHECRLEHAGKRRLAAPDAQRVRRPLDQTAADLLGDCRQRGDIRLQPVGGADSECAGVPLLRLDGLVHRAARDPGRRKQGGNHLRNDVPAVWCRANADDGLPAYGLPERRDGGVAGIAPRRHRARGAG